MRSPKLHKLLDLTVQNVFWKLGKSIDPKSPGFITLLLLAHWDSNFSLWTKLPLQDIWHFCVLRTPQMINACYSPPSSTPNHPLLWSVWVLKWPHRFQKPLRTKSEENFRQEWYSLRLYLTVQSESSISHERTQVQMSCFQFLSDKEIP